MPGDAVRTLTPWGWQSILATGPLWQVKMLRINPGHRTSLQKHNNRSEWWYVLDGDAVFTVGEKVFPSGDTSWVHVYSHHPHRISGLSPYGATILELQLTSIPGGISERDIVRLQDDYQRD